MTNNEIKKGASINSIKAIVINAGSSIKKSYIKESYYNRNRFEADSDNQDFANEVVKAIAEGDYGFASEIAKTVMKSGRCSEKQAYWIARAAWENEIDYIFGEGLADEIFRDADFEEEEEEAEAEEHHKEATAKTQISNLINGSEKTIRDIYAEKYAGIKFEGNKPVNGGTPSAERANVVKAVGAENPGPLEIEIKGRRINLSRHTSASGKSWSWEAHVDAELFAEVAGYLPEWALKGAENSYSLRVNIDCTVSLEATSGKKGRVEVIDESFITII